MRIEALIALFESGRAPLTGIVLCTLRLVPITYLCPLLGGLALPGTVRLALILSSGWALHRAGVRSTVEVGSLGGFVSTALTELMVGAVIGWVASLPFEGARFGGKLIDLFRGTSAEAQLPGAGSSDAASGEGLHRLAIALAASGLALPQVLGSIWRSFLWMPVGRTALGWEAILDLPRLATAMMACGLAISAPILVVTLGVEALVALAGRVAPGLPVQELSAPMRILGGAAVTWLGLSVMAQRIQQELLESPGRLEALLQFPR